MFGTIVPETSITEYCYFLFRQNQIRKTQVFDSLTRQEGNAPLGQSLASEALNSCRPSDSHEILLCLRMFLPPPNQERVTPYGELALSFISPPSFFLLTNTCDTLRGLLSQSLIPGCQPHVRIRHSLPRFRRQSPCTPSSKGFREFFPCGLGVMSTDPQSVASLEFCPGMPSLVWMVTMSLEKVFVIPPVPLKEPNPRCVSELLSLTRY